MANRPSTIRRQAAEAVAAVRKELAEMSSTEAADAVEELLANFVYRHASNDYFRRYRAKRRASGKKS